MKTQESPLFIFSLSCNICSISPISVCSPKYSHMFSAQHYHDTWSEGLKLESHKHKGSIWYQIIMLIAAAPARQVYTMAKWKALTLGAILISRLYVQTLDELYHECLTYCVQCTWRHLITISSHVLLCEFYHMRTLASHLSCCLVLRWLQQLPASEARFDWPLVPQVFCWSIKCADTAHIKF